MLKTQLASRLRSRAGHGECVGCNLSVSRMTKTGIGASAEELALWTQVLFAKPFFWSKARSFGRSPNAGVGSPSELASQVLINSL